MNCYISPLKTALLVLLAVTMTAVSYFVATHASDYRRVVGWIGVALFGLALVKIASQLFNKSPVVIIDEQGITATRNGPNAILWSQIDSVSIGKVQSTRFLCVWLKDEEAYLATLSTARAAMARANRSLGFPAISVSFQGLKPGLDDAYPVVLNHVPERSDA